MSVHKSQGGEHPAVVLVLLMQHYPLLQRNLIYTAVTRARQPLVVVGSPRAPARRHIIVAARHTHLAQVAGLSGASCRLMSS